MSADVPFDVRPGDGIGAVRLEMTRDEVEEALGGPSTPVDKGDAQPVAVFADLGLHAHFTAGGTCEAIEVMAPAEPTLEGLALLATPYDEMCDWLRARDPDLETAADGATSEALGVGLYAPHCVEFPHLPSESAIVFVRGYYDDGADGL